jgi:hypothetical protein
MKTKTLAILIVLATAVSGLAFASSASANTLYLQRSGTSYSVYMDTYAKKATKAQIVYAGKAISTSVRYGRTSYSTRFYFRPMGSAWANRLAANKNKVKVALYSPRKRLGVFRIAIDKF